LHLFSLVVIGVSNWGQYPINFFGGQGNWVIGVSIQLIF